MKTQLLSLIQKLKFLLSYLPFIKYKLPQGLTSFEEWSTRIIKKCGPLADELSMKYVLASKILHLPEHESKYKDSTFIKVLQKAAASQVASQVFQDIKYKQQQQKVADTTSTVIETVKVEENAQKTDT